MRKSYTTETYEFDALEFAQKLGLPLPEDNGQRSYQVTGVRYTLKADSHGRPSNDPADNRNIIITTRTESGEPVPVKWGELREAWLTHKRLMSDADGE